MLVVRNTFHLKFGKAKEAIALMKESLAIQKRAGLDTPTRILTDLTGRYYTLVLEITVKNLSELESTMPKLMGNPEWQANYQKVTPLVDSGHREIFTIVE